ncbi:hypothetical protein D9M69_569880 [compost metagenome]
MTAVDGLPALREVLKVSDVEDRLKLWPAITASGLVSPDLRLMFSLRSTPRKLTVWLAPLALLIRPFWLASAVTSLPSESVIFNWVLLRKLTV